jgi:hypothetical protein
MESPEKSWIANTLGLGRLFAALIVSVVAVAAFWSVLYGAGLLMASVVVAEVAVILILAFAYAWRSVR